MRCYVIMPYGKTEQDHKTYLRTYKLLIRSAVEECGLTCSRSDIDEKGGYIMSNVIEDLATVDLVIADLSGLNRNVAYELGIRHVLQKSGTILIKPPSPLIFSRSMSSSTPKTGWMTWRN